jgi:hypothetical protein
MGISIGVVALTLLPAVGVSTLLGTVPPDFGPSAILAILASIPGLD